MGADPEVLAVLTPAGLGDPAERFAAEDIDGATLWSLRDEDLRDHLAAVRSRLVSDDRGGDIRRCDRLLRSAP